MNFAQCLSICSATTIVLSQLMQLALALARQRTRRGVAERSLLRTGLAAMAMALMFATNAPAQEPGAASGSPTTQNNDASASKVSPAEAVTITSNDVMGFENPAAWAVVPDGQFRNFSVAPTTVRTQGNAALSIANSQGGPMTLTSGRVASTATAVAGIGNQGALLQLDILLPVEGGNSSDDQKQSLSPANGGWIDAFVSVPSRGLRNVRIGQVGLLNYRAGIYNTSGFSSPDNVSSALNGADFSDMVFEFVVILPGTARGTYLFDNLRVHSVELVQKPNGVTPPVGYGGSIDVTMTGNKPVKQTFSLDPIQIPSGLHLKMGTTGRTSVQLEAGVDANTNFTCTYVPDSSDDSGQSYKLQSCTGQNKAGDLISSNWVSVAIEGGEASQQLYAQLVLKPLGDLTGSDMLPAMPTFWGTANSCSPSPVAGKVVTHSSSCSSQTAQANSIITNYFNEVKSANPAAGWIVAPVPESATRRADGTPTTFVKDAKTAADSSDNLPFETGGDLNPGGSFDAYWKLSGNLDPTAVAGTDENLTHFDAAFTAHGVLFGDDVDVVDAKLTADTDSGETTPSYKPATSSGTLGFYVFGEEIPSDGITFTPSTGFNVDPSWSQEYDLPSIEIWIFDITLGADVKADLKASGSAALSGADLSITPSASVGGHISGGINLGIADGEVDAKVNLITLSAPMSAQAKLALNTSPAVCATQLSGSLKGDLDISSGGGEVDLDATFGYCPFCYTDSTTLFKWGALASASYNLFNDTLSYQAFGLPASLCPLATTANIVSPAAGASLSSGIPITLSGSAAPTDSSVPSVDISNTYQWTFTPGANASTATLNPNGAHSANPSVIFGAPKSGSISNWTINMAATTTVQSEGGAVLTKTTSAAPIKVTVTNLSPGDYITQVTSSNGLATKDSNGVYQLGNVPQNITFNGAVAGASGKLNTTFSALYCYDYTPACSNPGTPQFTTITTSGGSTTTPSAALTDFEDGYFLITMTTTSGGVAFNSASVLIYGTVLQ
jgi:hypothetical protein